MSTVKRLGLDLQELDTCPVGRVSARPLESNILQWHGNIQGIGNWTGCTLHFTIIFTDQYPSEPPKVLLATPFPHPNVITAADGSNEVCMDMLTSLASKDLKDGGRPYER